MLKSIFPFYYHVVKWNASMIGCSALPRKYNLLGLFWRIEIKQHFPLVRPLRYFLRSLLSVSVVTLGSTTEKSDISSAKSLTFDIKPLGKSFLYTKINKDPKIEPCRIPALTCDQYDDCPLRTTLWYWLLKKNMLTQKTFHISPITSVYTLALHAKLKCFG